jgi:hypothetical protein
MRPTASGVVDEIIARCLVEPTFLDALHSDAEGALDGYALNAQERRSFQELDTGRLRQFAGFVGKIQHNFLWESFPATLKVLRHLGIELEVFAQYRPFQLSPESRNAVQIQKIRNFLAFLDRYLTEHAQYAPLHAVMRHERAIWALRQTDSVEVPVHIAQSASINGMPWAKMSQLVPRINGKIRIEEFQYDPIALTANVLNGIIGRWPRRRSTLLAYWADSPTGQLRTFAIDGVSALLHARIDGFRCIGSIVAAVRRQTSKSLPPQEFRPFFEGAASAGLISFAEKET